MNVRILSALNIALFFLGTASHAQRNTNPLEERSPPIYFRLDWCPSQAELSELKFHLRISMTGCCVFRGFPVNPLGVEAGALSKYANRITSVADYTTKCSGESPEMIAEREAEQRSSLEAEAKRKEDFLRSIPGIVKAMGNPEICAALGQVFRQEEIENLGSEAVMYKAIRTEATSRKLTVNIGLTTLKKIRIGGSRCQVYASWGLPTNENRTVTAFSEDIQHVYGSTYVYTKNGTVTAFQD